jgi:hypothetical protein
MRPTSTDGGQSASIRIDGTIAQMCGAATLPGYRRRGVRTSLLRVRSPCRRLRLRVAVVAVRPRRSPGERPARGFSLLWSRVAGEER